jgi:hypothetical protein
LIEFLLELPEIDRVEGERKKSEREAMIGDEMVRSAVGACWVAFFFFFFFPFRFFSFFSSSRSFPSSSTRLDRQKSGQRETQKNFYSLLRINITFVPRSKGKRTTSLQ